MPFTGHENHNFPLETASEWTENYRNENPGSTKGHFFGKDAITSILAQSECVGIRIYYALDEAGEKQLVIVGVKADENDLFDGLIAERSFKCPPACGVNNPLNS